MKTFSHLLVLFLLATACSHKNIPSASPQPDEFRIPSRLPGYYPYYLIHQEEYLSQAIPLIQRNENYYHFVPVNLNFYSVEKQCCKPIVKNLNPNKNSENKNSSNYHPAIRIY